jgi:CRP-like cAMP-binding protein
LKHFPIVLVEDIMYFSQKSLIEPLFGQFESENLIRDITFRLQNQIFMPGDKIFKRKDKSRDCYFIIEGTVTIID